MPAKTDEQGPTILWLITQIEEFLTVNDLGDNEDNYFGWLAINDRTMVTRLRDGGDLSTSKMDEVISFMRSPLQHWLQRRKSTRGVGKIRALKPITITKEL